ncbi:MAG: FkbM family methyltransferase [Candidatus Dormibacteraeota bacterium]|nr:FkbM family methyltransferase [Candidatus Dormibacteraeota bacterium]
MKGTTTNTRFDPATAARIRLTVSCRDSDPIPKVNGAGQVVDGVQLMHNGVKVIPGCYYGDWMTEVIRGLRGHHEPQEEAAFHAIVEQLRRSSARPVMIECAAFWAYYSLWLLQAVPTASVVLVEPDPHNLAVGQENFRLNGRTGTWVNAAIGGAYAAAVPFRCESDLVQRVMPQESLSSLLARLGLDHVDILHVDAQGAEVAFIQNGRDILAEGRIRFCVISTHHHSIGGDPLAHERCVELFSELGAHLIAEHTVAESYSGDGLICASFDPRDKDLVVPISRARSREGIFGDPLADLARCQDLLADTGQQLAQTSLLLEEESRRRAASEASLAGAVRRRVRKAWAELSNR